MHPPLHTARSPAFCVMSKLMTCPLPITGRPPLGSVALFPIIGDIFNHLSCLTCRMFPYLSSSKDLLRCCSDAHYYEKNNCFTSSKTAPKLLKTPCTPVPVQSSRFMPNTSVQPQAFCRSHVAERQPSLHCVYPETLKVLC